MSIPLYGWVAMLLFDVVFVVLFRKHARSFFKIKIDMIAVFVCFVSANIFMLIIAFVVDTSGCSERPILACILNSNRGVWMFGALCIAVATLYFNTRMKESDSLSEERNRERSAEQLLIAASDEIVHNLQHFAYEIDENCEVISFPATSFESTFELKNSELSTYISRGVLKHVENLRRVTNHNLAIMNTVRAVDPVLKITTLMDDIGILTFSRHKWIEWHKEKHSGSNNVESQKTLDNNEDPSISKGVFFDGRIIAHMIRTLAMIAANYPSTIGHLTEDNCLNWLSLAASEINEKGGMWFTYRTSKITDSDGADIRSRAATVFCWINDSSVDGADVVPIRAEFRDLYHRNH